MMALKRLRDVEHIPIIKVLDVEPTTEELSKGIKSLACRKALGSDEITAQSISVGSLLYCRTPQAPLPVLERRCCSTGYERHKHHYIALNPLIKTRKTGATATTTVVSPYSASLVNALPELHSIDSKSLQRNYTQNHRQDSELVDKLHT